MPAKTPARQVALLVALLVAIAAILAYQFRGPRVAAPAGQRVAVKADPSRAAAARDHAE